MEDEMKTSIENKVEKEKKLKEKIVEIIKENGEIKLKDIYDKVTKPGATVRATIYQSIKKDEGIFVKTDKGKYTLKKNETTE